MKWSTVIIHRNCLISRSNFLPLSLPCPYLGVLKSKNRLLLKDFWESCFVFCFSFICYVLIVCCFFFKLLYFLYSLIVIYIYPTRNKCPFPILPNLSTRRCLFRQVYSWKSSFIGNNLKTKFKISFFRMFNLLVSFAAVFRLVTQLLSTNGCFLSNHIPFPLFVGRSVVWRA